MYSKKTFKFLQDGPRIVVKGFLYNSGLILSIWEKPQYSETRIYPNEQLCS